MTMDEKIARINELYHKAKNEGLTGSVKPFSFGIKLLSSISAHSHTGADTILSHRTIVRQFQNCVSHTSRIVGMEEEAPERETAIAAALEAMSKDAAPSFPAVMDAMKKPVKVSPAAVVSTAGTL